MAIGDLNDGSRFGLPPIGLPQAHLDTPGSDTERRSFPGLATKSSVFAWMSPTQPALLVDGPGAGANYTINMRQNTATGGSSVDVPTWAAGVVIRLFYFVSTMGTSTWHAWTAYAPVSNNVIAVFSTELNAVTLNPLGYSAQFIVPFYDEPVFKVSQGTNGTGTATTAVSLVGFVRNV